MQDYMHVKNKNRQSETRLPNGRGTTSLMFHHVEKITVKEIYQWADCTFVQNRMHVKCIPEEYGV